MFVTVETQSNFLAVEIELNLIFIMESTRTAGDLVGLEVSLPFPLPSFGFKFVPFLNELSGSCLSVVPAQWLTVQNSDQLEYTALLNSINYLQYDSLYNGLGVTIRHKYM